MIEDYNSLKNILPSKTWCPQVLTGLSIQTKGIGPCCEYLNPITVKTVTDYKSSDKFKRLKFNMENNLWDEGCAVCRIREEHGEISQRMKEVYNQIRPFNLENYNTQLFYDLYNNNEYLWVNIAPSNKCNLACIICYPGASSKLEQEVLDNPDHWMDIPHEIQAFDDLSLFTKDLHEFGRLFLTGGEPTVMSELIRYLKKVNKNIYVETVSNFNVYNEKFWDLLFSFKQVHVMASIDAIGKRAEYIRYGCNWNQVEKNILRFRDNAPSNVDFKIITGIAIYNILYFDELVEWVNKHDLKLGVNNVVLNPEHFSITKVIHHSKKDFFLNIVNGLQYIPYDNISQQHYENLKTTIKKANFNHEKFITMIRVLDKIDKIRNLNWKNTFPKLLDYIEDVKNK